MKKNNPSLMTEYSSFEDQKYIEIIRQKLWCGQEFGQVAVMVGSGFSRNADKISHETPPFPLWKDLSKKFAQTITPQGKMSNIEYEEKIDKIVKMSDPIQLAQEVHDSFGPSFLDDLLIRSIPDTQYVPGNLHRLLLNLPWSDVFTTNFDSLLERTLPNIYEKKYDLVTTVQDIPQKMRPRIIKLHGSYPSQRPFITTNNHYLNYLRDFSPFTNLVQQSIMENIFCLIGFSSDDPNFLKWREWVLDKLEDYAPHVYLCGILELTEERRNEFLRKKIIPIDLAPLFPKNEWIDPDLRHKNALEWFLLNLMYGAPPNPSRWPEPTETSHWKPSNDLIPAIPPGPPQLPKLGSLSPKNTDMAITEEIDEVYRLWKIQREHHPGWIITPYDNRDRLLNYTLRWINPVLESLKNIPAPQNLFVLYELNWRIDICFLPLFVNWIEFYEQILLSYNPYPKLVKIDGCIYSPDKVEFISFDWNNIGICWVDLVFSLIKENRWDQNTEKFYFWMNTIEKIVRLNPYWQLKWHYEKCMWSLASFNQKNLKTLLKNWPETENLPFFEIKRGALLAEIGELDEAKRIVENALSNIRSHLHSKEKNYLFLSQEGWSMLLLRSIEINDSLEKINLIDYHRDRWDRLAIYKCNPWLEIDKLHLLLKNEPSNAQYGKSNDEGFDPGKSSTTYHFISEPKVVEALPAFAFLRIFENAALPMNCGQVKMFHEEIANASKWIEQYSSPWAISSIIRTGNEKAIRDWFVRSRVVSMKMDQIDNLYTLLINSLKQSLEILSNKSDLEAFRQESFSILLVKISSEILSRISFRLSESQIDELLEVSCSMFSRNIIVQKSEFWDEINNLFERILYSLPDSKIIENLNDLLDLPLFPCSDTIVHVDRLSDPFSYIHWIGDEKISEQNQSQFSQKIKELLELTEKGHPEERKRAIIRLIKLNEIDGLSDSEKGKFAFALWSRCDAMFGLPSETGLLASSFLFLPEAEKGEAHSRVKNYLSSIEIPKPFIQKISKEGKPSLSTDSGSRFQNYIREWEMATGSFNQILERKNEFIIDWNNDEILSLIAKIKNMWEKDRLTIKKFKDKNFLFFSDNARIEISGLIRLLEIVVLPNIQKIDNSEIKQNIKQLIEEMESDGLCINSIITLRLFIERSNYDDIVSKLRRGLISLDIDEIKYSVYGLYYWILLGKSGAITHPPNDLINEIVNQISNRRQPNLLFNLPMITSILNDYPDYLTPENIQSLCVALEYLIIETEIKSIGSCEQSVINWGNIPYSQRPRYREKSIVLASALYNNYVLKSLAVPSIILKWKDVSEKDILPEVRRGWMSAIF